MQNRAMLSAMLLVALLPFSSQAGTPPMVQAGPMAIMIAKVEVPTAIASYGAQANLRAIVRVGPGNDPVSLGHLSFRIGGAVVGTCATNSLGECSYSYFVPSSLPAGANVLEADFDGSGTTASGQTAGAAKGTGNLAVEKSASTLEGSVGAANPADSGPDGFANGATMHVHGTLKRITDHAGIEGREIHIRRDGVVVKSVSTTGGGQFDATFELEKGPAKSVAVDLSFDGDTHYLASANPTVHIAEKMIQKGTAWATISAPVLTPPSTGYHVEQPITLVARVSGQGDKPIAGVCVQFVVLASGNPMPQKRRSDPDGNVQVPYTFKTGGFTAVQATIDDPQWIDGCALGSAGPCHAMTTYDLEVHKAITEVSATGPASAKIGSTIPVNVVLRRRTGEPIGNQRVYAGSESGMTDGSGHALIQVHLAGSYTLGAGSVPVSYQGDGTFAESHDKVAITLTPADN